MPSRKDNDLREGICHFFLWICLIRGVKAGIFSVIFPAAQAQIDHVRILIVHIDDAVQKVRIIRRAGRSFSFGTPAMQSPQLRKSPLPSAG